MTQGDIHARDSTFKRLKNQIKTSPDIEERDKKILLSGVSETPSFLSYMQNQGLSTSRINRYLRTWKRTLKREDWSIEEANKKKITGYVGKLNTDRYRKKNGDPYSESTKREIKKGIRKMYVDYVDEHKDSLNFSEGFDPEDLITFTLTIERTFTDPDRLPTPYTVKTLVEKASRPRDKAYIMLLWSTGGRNGEILGLKWQDVDFTGNIGKVTFRDTKTGGDHSVPMAEALPFMRQHKKSDPRSDEPEAYVFRSSQSDEQYSSNGAAEIINRARKDTDIPQKIKTNPHAFRKGRTSYWARQGQNETWICKHMNWAPGSKIVRHYCRIAQENIEEGVSKHLGLYEQEDEKDESKILTPSECHSCRRINGFDTDTCIECGEVLKASDLYNEAKIQEMKEEVKSEMIEQGLGKSREDVRQVAEQVVEEEF